MALRVCPVDSCDLRIFDEHVMCRAHWRMVPAEMQTAVWRAFHQHEARREDRNRLNALRQAQAAAVRAVNEKVAA